MNKKKKQYVLYVILLDTRHYYCGRNKYGGALWSWKITDCRFYSSYARAEKVKKTIGSFVFVANADDAVI